MLTQKKKKRFIVFNSIGKRQATKNVAMADADFDKRHNCTFEIEDVVTSETVYDCGEQDVFDETTESQLKKLTVTYTSVTPQIIAFWLAYFLSAAAAPVTVGAKKRHALTRSSNDALAGFGFVEGFEDDATAPQKYKDFKVDSLAFTLNRRKSVGLTVIAFGHFETENVGVSWVLPECQNLPALKGRECKFLLNSVDKTDLLWQAGLNLSNSIPTGDDAFEFDSVNLDELERGEKPTYPGNVQLLGSKGDSHYTLGLNRTKVPVELQLGADASDRVNLVMPATLVKLASTPTVFVGELNRSAVALDLSPHKDGVLKAPLKADAYLDQTTAFLTV